MSKEELQVNFRMPAALKGELEALAKQNRRSLTAEVVARLQESLSNDPEPGLMGEHEAALRLMAKMYQDTLDRIAVLKAQSALSTMEQYELQHEEATAQYLRHAAARASIPPQERPRQRKESMPLGIDTDVYMATRAALSAPHPKQKK